jgi:tetratricopeptide (TPR) repeat protein
MRESAIMTLLQVSNSMYQSGDYIGASVVLTEMLKYAWNREIESGLHSLRSDAYIKLGEFDSAIADLSVAVDLASREADLNLMCWYNGIIGQAEEALQYCEQAVKADPSSMNRDSRGLVYAQLGDYEAAIEDFQSIVEDYENASDPGLKKIHDSRQAWLETLQAGNNPITPEVLGKLQQDEIQPSTPIFGPGEYGDRTRAGFRQSAQEVGFIFGEVEMSDGQEFITGVLSEDDCNGELVLTGPQEGINAATMHLTGCEDDYQQGKQYWFMSQFLSEYTDVIRAAFVWGTTDIYYVIEGIEKETLTKQFGDVQFSVRNIPGDATTFEITAEVVE